MEFCSETCDPIASKFCSENPDPASSLPVLKFESCNSEISNLLTSSKSKDLYILTDFCLLIELYGGNKMTTFTVSIPEELKAKLDKHPEINWSEVMRKAFAKRVELLKKFEEEHKGEL